MLHPRNGRKNTNPVLPENGPTVNRCLLYQIWQKLLASGEQIFKMPQNQPQPGLIPDPTGSLQPPRCHSRGKTKKEGEGSENLGLLY